MKMKNPIIKVLEKTYIEQILNFQEYIYDTIERKETYEKITKEEFIDVYNRKGIIIGTIIGEKIAGIVCFLPVGDRFDNLGKDIELPEDELNKVIHLETALVDPVYRGNGLMKKMSDFFYDSYSDYLSKYKYIMGTADPNNYSSNKSFFNMGFYAITIKEKYKGKIRYILYKEIGNKEIYSDPICLDCNIDKHYEMFKKGYYLIDYKKEHNNYLAVFVKKQ